MNTKAKTILVTIGIWMVSIILTLGFAVYQRMTGPTYPVRGTSQMGDRKISFRLIRSWDQPGEAKFKIVAPDTAIRGEIVFRRFKSLDKWQAAPMVRNGDTLTGALPHLPPAGKIMYEVTLAKGDRRVQLTEHPAVLRYTGFVPRHILGPHILLMFLAMLFSVVTALTILFRGRSSYTFAWLTMIAVGVGGLILGPIVQKYAFDAYWTGWPFGHDLTDNKSLVAFIFWLIAVVVLKRHRENRIWPLLASLILLVVFLIPHSVLGSEIDYTKAPQVENRQ